MRPVTPMAGDADVQPVAERSVAQLHGAMTERAVLPGVHREHLEALVGELGIPGSADAATPDHAAGRCADDMARGLMVDLLHARIVGWEGVAASAARSVRFLGTAIRAGTGRARSLREPDGTWVDEDGCEATHGRVLLALGEAIRRVPDPDLRHEAAVSFAEALPAALEMTGMQARSLVVLACDAAGRDGGFGSPLAVTYRRLAASLRRAFEARGYVREWPWPEDSLGQENGLPAHALIVAGSRLGDADAVDTGLRALDWLVAVQTVRDGRLSPVGCDGWWPRDGARARFDQRPCDVASLLLAADAAYRRTARETYRGVVEHAYAWFLGANDVGVAVADPERGACHDRLTPDGVTPTEGAAATLTWLTALEHVRALRQLSETGAPAVGPDGLAGRRLAVRQPERRGRATRR